MVQTAYETTLFMLRRLQIECAPSFVTQLLDVLNKQPMINNIVKNKGDNIDRLFKRSKR